MKSIAMLSRRRKPTQTAVEAEKTQSDTVLILSPTGTSNVSQPVSSEAKPKPRLSKRRGFSMFTIGGIVGMLAAAFVLQDQGMMNLEALADIRLDALADVIPAGILKEATDISQREKDKVPYDAFSVGLALKAEGLKAEHPVIMVPGVISTGLESWGTEPSSRKWFRKRLWGSWHMLRALVVDNALWKQHIMLDKETGLDPPGVKLRAAQGFDATDFFITGYWIWNKIIENLATIGYDPTNSFTAAYDWRLSYINLETRDQYFTRLKTYIETAHRIAGKKVVLVSHSMGSQVAMFFFKWVETEGYGGGGSAWVETHIEAFINISGCMLGAAKGVPAVISGEMKDTAQLNSFAVYGLEKFFSRQERAEILRAMPGISSMLPKGGEAVWGNLTWAPDDMEGQETTYGAFIKFTEVVNGTEHSSKNLTVSESIDYLLKYAEPWYRKAVLESYSHGIAASRNEVEANEKIPSKWVNPLEVRLPYAPSMKIYCFYGIGKPTERSYYYRDSRDPQSKLNITIDTSINGGGSDHGVVVGEGDGTVSLISAGYMCAKGWKIHRYNPAKIPIKIYEMPHEPSTFDIRGGPNTGDHVDILGRQRLNELILRVAAGRGNQIKENILSNIMEISERVKIYEDAVAGPIAV
ncbi:lecithin,cholesterol acyltransferase /Acyl-ceramide synthase [Kalaharituber pfeilii]|nr:lecithin,cholesterol acyltransferase /Acyl-ceramide synthase [Kalaharituber pfeilii]